MKYKLVIQECTATSTVTLKVEWICLFVLQTIYKKMNWNDNITLPAPQPDTLQMLKLPAAFSSDQVASLQKQLRRKQAEQSPA